jgi:hypothetical protein
VQREKRDQRSTACDDEKREARITGTMSCLRHAFKSYPAFGEKGLALFTAHVDGILLLSYPSIKHPRRDLLYGDFSKGDIP